MKCLPCSRGNHDCQHPDCQCPCRRLGETETGRVQRAFENVPSWPWQNELFQRMVRAGNQQFFALMAPRPPDPVTFRRFGAGS